MAKSWREYWNGQPAVYVNDVHLRVHSERVAADIVAVIAGRPLIVLDFGCGEALSAGRVAAACSRLYLCDGASKVCDQLAARFAGTSKVVVLRPEQLEGIPAGSIDLIVVNSVVQYLSRPDLSGLLAVWRRLLSPQGRLLIADVIPPDQSALADALSLLRFGAANGFLAAAIGGLVRIALSDYRQLRAELGLSVYSEAEMVELLQSAGFVASRHLPNLGHNQQRLAFMAKPA